ncbi:MAG TPA: chemotaxis protein CheA [Gemmatimonadaceae bacterium]|nr:chemotaxis protein CheA [Gemmatimonadaceae bacterium]
MDTSRYADLFLTESREHLSAINHALLSLEREPGAAEPVQAIFRAVHTVKGMSATMGYTAVAELSHELETLLDRVRRGERAVTPDVMDTLFRAADTLERAVELAVAGRPAEGDARAVIARLRELATIAGAKAGRRAGGRKGAARAAAAGGWTIAAPAGSGVLVRVRVDDGALLKGVRAFMAVQKAQSLGELEIVVPPVEAMQAEGFDGELALRLRTSHTAATIEETLRAIGDIARVSVAEGVASAAPAPGPSAPVEVADPASGRPEGDPPDAGDAGAAEGAILRQQRHVRIDLRRLDALMNLIGELVITRGRLAQLAGTLHDPALDEAVAQASRLVSELQDQIMTSRLVPVWQVFDRFPRLVRDAARALGKQVEFSVEGKEIELDRSMLDEIGDPIVHLLRNAIDHGIESPEVRARAGKAPAGRLTLSATRDRSSVVIRVGDDGRGINREKVLARAKGMGLVDAGKAELSDEELVRLISRPGFSTADRVTDISGRGVGIDAVQSRVRALGGSVEIRSAPGAGTTVAVRLPLTLAIVGALLSRVGEETYAIPLTHVNETVKLQAGDLRTVKGKEVLVLREDVMPLVRLRELVSFASEAPPPVEHAVVLEVAERRAALVVDELVGQQEIVVKQFDGVREGLAVFGGATILGDGAPALIVDVNSLL